MANNSGNSSNNSNSIVQKIFSNYLFRVMAAWFGVYIKDKVQAAVDYVIGKAGVIYVGTTENVRTILDFFNTHDLVVGDNTYRYIGEVEEAQAPATGFVYQFGLLTDADGHVSDSDVVYGDRRDYDDLTEGDTVYKNGQEETVTAVTLPTKGYVNLTGFEEPLQVVEGTNYMN